MSESGEMLGLAGEVSVLSGFAFPSSGFNRLEGLPLVRIRDLARATTEVRFKGNYDPVFVVKRDDVLVGMDGDFEVYRWGGDDALLNQRVCKVTTTSEAIDQRFLYWYLKPKIAEIHRRTPQTTVRHLSTKEIYAIPRPPITSAEQSAASLVLDTIDTAIHQTEAIIEKLKQLKQGLLRDLLTRGVDANGELRPSREEAPELYQRSTLRWIPKVWTAKPLGDSIHLVSGQHIATELCNSAGKGVPYFTGPSDFSGATTVVTSYTTHPQVMCEKGDLLITVKGSGCGKVALAGARACISRQLMAIRVSEKTRPYWLAVLQSLQERFNRMATGGNIPGIGRDQILGLVYSTPNNPEEMEAIGDQIQATDTRLNIEAAQLAKLRVQKSGLMDDLLTGRVRVTPLLEAATP